MRKRTGTSVPQSEFALRPQPNQRHLLSSWDPTWGLSGHPSSKSLGSPQDLKNPLRPEQISWACYHFAYTVACQGLLRYGVLSCRPFCPVPMRHDHIVRLAGQCICTRAHLVSQIMPRLLGCRESRTKRMQSLGKSNAGKEDSEA